MALGNGVLVHGPTAWACAIRTESGDVKVVARRKGLQASKVANPLFRGPAKLAEAFALLPQVKHALPEAQLPFQRPRVLGAMVGSVVAGSLLRRSKLRTATQETIGALLSVAPAVLALRGGELAAYHGAEHITIGGYLKAARAAGALGAVAVSTELFGWMTRHPGHVLARGLAWPGHELQHRFATAEPDEGQLEVADAALRACLELEDAAAAAA